MLQDARRGLLEEPDQPQGTVQVEQVVVGKLLTVQYRGGRQIRTSGGGIHIKGGPLVRILTVSKPLSAGEFQVQLWRKRNGSLMPGASGCGEIPGDYTVVGSLPVIGLASEELAGAVCRSDCATTRCENRGVLVGTGEDGHVIVILRAAPDQRRATDIDVLDRIFKGGRRVRDGLFEGIEVHHDQVDRLDPLRGECLEIAREMAAGQDTPVDLG